MMVELPRNPLDERIDRLSQAAIGALSKWDGVTHSYAEITPWLQELVDARMALHVGGVFKFKLDGGRQRRTYSVSLAFDGNNAQQRINSGVYAHHKAIYEKRAARDDHLEALEALPIWGSF